MRIHSDRRAPLAASVLFALGLTVLTTSSGCAEVDGDESESSTTSALAAVPQKSVCFGGRSWGDPRSNGGIPEIEALCNRLPGLVRDVPGGRDAEFPFFQWNTPVAYVLDRLVAVLDTNRDGNVTNLDTAVELNVIGFSWGGYNGRDLVAAINDDRRFSPSRKNVTRFFALDAYMRDYLLFPRSTLDVPGNVRSFWSFRHTREPADECSRIIFGMVGPFTGRPPRCTGSTTCKDYDYSLSPSTAHVDHCDVPEVADDAVLALIAGRTPTGLPRERAVARY